MPASADFGVRRQSSAGTMSDLVRRRMVTRLLPSCEGDELVTWEAGRLPYMAGVKVCTTTGHQNTMNRALNDGFDWQTSLNPSVVILPE